MPCRTTEDGRSGHFGSCTPLNVPERLRTAKEHRNCNRDVTAAVRSISYTSYNKPSSITQGSATLLFSHDIDHQRFKQQAPEGTTMLIVDALRASRLAAMSSSAPTAAAPDLSAPLHLRAFPL